MRSAERLQRILYGHELRVVDRQNRNHEYPVTLRTSQRRLSGLVRATGMPLIVLGILLEQFLGYGILSVLARKKMAAMQRLNVGLFDPVFLFGAPILLLVIGLIAALAPAFKTSSVNPAGVLSER